MVVTRLPGHQPTAEVSDGCSLGPAELLGRKLGLTPLPWGRASVQRLGAGAWQEGEPVQAGLSENQSKLEPE